MKVHLFIVHLITIFFFNFSFKFSRKFQNAFSRLQPKKPESEKCKILTLRELNEQSNTKMQETYVLQKYKETVRIAVEQIEKKFKEYDKNPESHPQYSEEWKSFWSRRYKELTLEKLDANGHDYKPEWIQYWTMRMKELHKLEIDKKKETCRKSLGLSIETVMQLELDPRSRSRSPRANRSRKRSDSPIKISDDSDDDRSIRSNDSRSKRRRTEHRRESDDRSRSRFSDDSPYGHSNYRGKDSYESSYRRDRERKIRSKSPEIFDDGPVNLISVCRLLSALESELGLMAKTIIDLLAKAVSLEKLKPNSADELLLNSENCNVLETVKEKLKGILTANLIEPNKKIAVKRAIQNIATLLHEVSSRMPSTSNALILKTFSDLNSEKVSVAEVDPVAAAKHEIAKVITESLLLQGRNDLSTEELEALVESFMQEQVGQEESKQVAVISDPQPSTSANFFQPKKQQENGNSELENLTDEDLQTLLRNFADLAPDEQSHLIAHLSKIEQTDLARVEKLRKYVYTSDNDQYNEEQKLNSLPEKVKEKSPSRERLVRQDLSDDDYDDDAMAKKLGMNGAGSSHLGDVTKSYSSNGGSVNSLKDSHGLANSLMSSLMQSSQPARANNTYDDYMQKAVSMSSAYYQQPQMQYDMMGYPNMGMAQMPMNLGIPQMDMPMQYENQWPQNSASNFFQEMEIPSTFSNKNKKRNEFLNNRQLSVKGKHSFQSQKGKP